MILQNGNGPDKWTPACDNPNPPFWCDNNGGEVAANIDNPAWVLIICLLIGIVLYNKLSKQ